MALQKQKQSLIFDKGIDTKTNPKITDGYLELDNCFIDNVSINKSTGYKRLITGVDSNDEDLRGLIADSHQLIPILNDTVFTYDAELNRNIERGPMSYLDRVTTTTTQVQGTIFSNATPPIPQPDNQNNFYSEYGNFEAICYRDVQNNVRLRINDKVNEITLVEIQINDPTNAPSPRRVLAITCTQKAVFVYSTTDYGSGGPVDEWVVFYDSSLATTKNSAVIALLKKVSTTSGAFYYPFPEMTLEYDGQFVWVFYVTNAGVPTVIVRSLFSSTEATITPGGAFTRVIDVATNNYFRASMCSLFIDQSTFPGPPFVPIEKAMLWIVEDQLYIFNAVSRTFIRVNAITTNIENYSQSIAINSIDLIPGNSVEQVFILNLSPAEYCTPVQLESFPPRIYNNLLGSGAATLYTTVPAYWTQGVTAADKFLYGTAFVGGGLFSTATNTYFVLATMPYIQAVAGGIAVAGATTAPNNIKVNYYLVDVKYNMVDHMTHFIGSQKAIQQVFAGTTQTIYNAVPFGPVVTKNNIVTNEINYCTIEELQTQIAGGTVTFSNGLKTQQISQNAFAKVYIAERGNGTYFGASDLKKLTPSTLDEVNFLDFSTVTATFTPAGAGVNTFYAYTVTFEYTDSEGELTRSYPATPVSINIAVPSTVTLYFTPPSWLETKQNIVVKIWRTTVNSTLYYLLTTKIWPIGAATSNIFNPANFDPIYVDAVTAASDTALRGNEVAYFNGGVLGELPFETFSSMTLHNNRLFLVKASNLTTIQYSLPFQPSVSAATSFGLEFFVEPQGGAITFLASLDDKLIIFKRDFIYAVAGDGVDALGANNSLTVPFRINSPVGCSEPLSVVRMPEGIMFKSLKGIYLLKRDLSLDYIGAPVEGFNDLVISSATLNTTLNKVEFTTYNGTMLIYDYYYNYWSTESGLILYATTNYLTGFFGVDSGNNLLTLFNGYYKNGHPYSMTIQTPWIKTSGLQGFQRAYWLLVLGTWQGPSSIRIGVAYDFIDVDEYWLDFSKDDTNSYGTGTWGVLTPFGGTERSNFEIRFNLPRQKCQAIRFTITDQFSNIATETGNSFSLQELALVYGALAVDVKLPVNRRV